MHTLQIVNNGEYFLQLRLEAVDLLQLLLVPRVRLLHLVGHLVDRVADSTQKPENGGGTQSGSRGCARQVSFRFDEFDKIRVSSNDLKFHHFIDSVPKIRKSS